MLRSEATLIFSRSNDDHQGQRRPHPRRPRHRDGRVHAAVLDPGRQVERAAARRRADAADAAGREADRLPRHQRPRRRDGPPVPAPLRVAVPRPQRGGRHALHLPRLEVRRRTATASTCPACRPSQDFKDKVKAKRLQGGRAQRHHLGLHGPAPDDAAAAADGRGHAAARGRRWTSPSCSATATGCRRSKATSTPRTSASCTWATSTPTTCRDGHPLRAHRRRARARVPRARRALGHHLRRLPHGDGRETATYWRFANYMFPFWTQTPQGEFPRHVHARAWVPLDDDAHDVRSSGAGARA